MQGDINLLGLQLECFFWLTNELTFLVVIPSTPSVAFADKKGGILYFGPYGLGLGCSDTVGYAKTMLGNYLKGYSANILVKDAKGC